MRYRVRSTPLLALLALALPGCAPLAGLGAVIQPPRFEMASDRPSELRLLAPAAERPLGGAAVRLWARVENPNAFGLTLSTLAGTLFLEGQQAAQADFPLGLPLAAAADTVIPLDLIVSFADVPGLANVALQLVERSQLGYRLDGRASVDAGLLGQPVFGPMTLLEGLLHVRR